MREKQKIEEMYAKAFEDAEAHPENYDDIFAGYENNLNKAVALIEWQKQEIESLTIRMNAFGLAVKSLAEERSKYFLIKENGEVVPIAKQSEGEWTYGVDREGTMKCTLCRRRMPKIDNARYCPNCGAKMKGGAE